jgi:hypothetical protein
VIKAITIKGVVITYIPSGSRKILAHKININKATELISIKKLIQL